MKNRPSIWASFALAAAEALLSSPAPAQNSATINFNDSRIVYSHGSNESPPDWNPGTDSNGNPFAVTNAGLNAANNPATQQAYGASAVLIFQGTSVQVTGAVGPNSGVAGCAVDGVLPQFTDTYNSGGTKPATIYTSGNLQNEIHVAQCQTTQSKNPSSSGTNFGLYSFAVQNGDALSLGNATGAVGYTDFISGQNGTGMRGAWSWGSASDGSDLGGGHMWTNDTSAYLTWNVPGGPGTKVLIVGRPDSEDGAFTVCFNNQNCTKFWAGANVPDNDWVNSDLMVTAVLPNGGGNELEIYNNGPGYLQPDKMYAFAPNSGGGGGGGGTPPGGGSSLPAGTYNLVDQNGNLLDFGFLQAGLWSYNNGPHQQATYSASGTLCDTIAGGTNLCLVNQGGLLTQGGGADAFTIASVAGGYAIRDQTGAYLQGSEQLGGRMTFSSNPYVWKLTPVSGQPVSAPPPSGPPAAGNYYVTDSTNNAIDAGFPLVSTFPLNRNPHQVFTLSASNTLCNTVAGGTSLCLSDQGGFLTQGSTADMFVVNPVSGGGFTVQDTATGRFVQGGVQPDVKNPPRLPLTPTSSTNQSKWNFVLAP